MRRSKGKSSKRRSLGSKRRPSKGAARKYFRAGTVY